MKNEEYVDRQFIQMIRDSKPAVSLNPEFREHLRQQLRKEHAHLQPTNSLGSRIKQLFTFTSGRRWVPVTALALALAMFSLPFLPSKDGEEAVQPPILATAENTESNPVSNTESNIESNTGMESFSVQEQAVETEEENTPDVAQTPPNDSSTATVDEAPPMNPNSQLALAPEQPSTSSTDAIDGGEGTDSNQETVTHSLIPMDDEVGALAATEQLQGAAIRFEVAAVPLAMNRSTMTLESRSQEKEPLYSNDHFLVEGWSLQKTKGELQLQLQVIAHVENFEMDIMDAHSKTLTRQTMILSDELKKAEITEGDPVSFHVSIFIPLSDNRFSGTLSIYPAETGSSAVEILAIPIEYQP